MPLKDKSGILIPYITRTNYIKNAPLNRSTKLANDILINFLKLSHY